jgi:hypothetical protein
MVFRAFDLWKLGEPGPPASTYWSSQPFWNQMMSMPAARGGDGGFNVLNHRPGGGDVEPARSR